MASILEGGCRVSGLREGEALRLGNLRMWTPVGRATGARAISLRILECARGLSPALRNASCDEVLYVLAGGGAVILDGASHDVAADTGIYLRPGSTLSVLNESEAPLIMVSSRCPEPEESGIQVEAPAPSATSAMHAARPPLVRLSDREALPSGDRWYRVLVDGEVGSEQVTQFVGSIPPGRAPDHHHHYEEVLCVLRGRGVMWAGSSSAPIEAGSCIYLPRRQNHCVENTGAEELRLLGVFYPAGSPAVSYDAPGAPERTPPDRRAPTRS